MGRDTSAEVTGQRTYCDIPDSTVNSVLLQTFGKKSCFQFLCDRASLAEDLWLFLS